QAGERNGSSPDADAAPGPRASGRDRDRDRGARRAAGELGGRDPGPVPPVRQADRGGVRRDGRAARQGRRVRDPGLRRHAGRLDRRRLLRRDGPADRPHDLAVPGAGLALQLPRIRAPTLNREIPMTFPVAVRWSEDGAAVDLLDQTRLPEAEVRLRIETADAMAEAIRTLRVRGAPAIGIAAAMGVAVESARHVALPDAEFRARVRSAIERLAATRPTAVNLAWALERMRRRMDRAVGQTPQEVSWALFDEANAILVEDRGMCRRIGEWGLDLLPDGDVSVLTHCNAGALATGGIGTALAPVYLAHALGRRVRVYVGETRPLLQGSRITAWELQG